MRSTRLYAALAVLLGSVCLSVALGKSVEYLDERSAMTVGALKEPLELVPGASQAFGHLIGRRVTFAYLGPVEWDRSGEIEYGLWVHIAPSGKRVMVDIRSPAAVTLMLDDEAVPLAPMDAPQLGRAPYQPVASWGQTAYFQLDVATLKRMASSKVKLAVRMMDGGVLNFIPADDPHPVLKEYLHDRALNAD